MVSDEQFTFQSFFYFADNNTQISKHYSGI